MDILSLSYPIPSHETWAVIDSTKLQTFLTCPREFFYKYILGWREEKPNEHLGFGSAWHEAMEYFMQIQDGEKKGYDADDIIEAFIRFSKTYDEKMGIGGEVGGLSDLAGYSVQENKAKNKGNGGEALIEYARTYRSDQFKTLFTEVSGTISIHDDRVIYFKLDSILDGLKTDPGIWSYEHKTTGRKMQAWMDQWPLIPQIGTYSHVLYTYYGDRASGIKINGAIIRAPRADGTSTNEFIRIPIHITRELMLMWLWETNNAMEELERNMKLLSQADPSDKILQAFPRNGYACSKNFTGCPFTGICSAWANPLKHGATPPPGYKQEFWDPRGKVEEGMETLEQGTVKAVAKRAG